MKANDSVSLGKRPVRVPGWWGETIFSSGAFFARPLLQPPQTGQPFSFSGSRLFDLPWGICVRCKMFERYSIFIRIVVGTAMRMILKRTFCPFASSKI
jgi:hypothetical protein